MLSLGDPPSRVGPSVPVFSSVLASLLRWCCSQLGHLVAPSGNFTVNVLRAVLHALRWLRAGDGTALWASEGLSSAGWTLSLLLRLFVCPDLWFPLQPLLTQQAVWAVTPLPIQRQERALSRGGAGGAVHAARSSSVQMGEAPPFEGLVPELDSELLLLILIPVVTCPPGGEAQRGTGPAPTCLPDGAASTSSLEAVD